MALSQATRLHGPLSPRDVDEMDLTLVWAFLGGSAEEDDRRAAFAAAQAAPDVAMVPLTPEEKAARLAARKATEAARMGPRRRSRTGA